MRPPVNAMDLEPGVHVTLKFHLPYRLILKRTGSATAEADQLVLSVFDDALEALRKPQEDNKNG